MHCRPCVRGAPCHHRPHGLIRSFSGIRTFRSGYAVAGMPARLQLVQTILPHVAVAREANAEGLLRGVVLQGLLPSFARTCLCQRPAPYPQPGAMKHAEGCPAMLASRPSAELAAASAARRLPAANQNAKLEAVAYSAFSGQHNTYSSMLDLQQIEGGRTSRAGCGDWRTLRALSSQAQPRSGNKRTQRTSCLCSSKLGCPRITCVEAPRPSDCLRHTNGC